jgi:hypothetical protein
MRYVITLCSSIIRAPGQNTKSISTCCRATLPCGAHTPLFRLLDTQNEALRAPHPTHSSFADPSDIIDTSTVYGEKNRENI